MTSARAKAAIVGVTDAVSPSGANVVDCDPKRVRIGDLVKLVWEPLTDGRNLPVFELDQGAG